jgi:hypothetical protein
VDTQPKTGHSSLEERSEGFQAYSEEQSLPLAIAMPFADLTENIFLKRGVWVWLHVGHNKQITALKDDRMVDNFQQKYLPVYKDNLQVKTTARAGWLLRSHTMVPNPQDLEDASALLPEMFGLPAEIQIEWISFNK